MSVSLVPDYRVQDYREVTPSLLRRMGVSLLLCDLDYTLAPKSRKLPDEGVRTWLRSMREAGITVMVVSNNRSGTRAGVFCEPLALPYVRHAGKPSRRGLRQAMAQAGRTAAETAVLGDKLLTDVLAARRLGAPVFMVEPLGGPVGLWNRVLHVLQAPFRARGKKPE